jgi:Flp pilus assembly secretin CpaC
MASAMPPEAAARRRLISPAAALAFLAVLAAQPAQAVNHVFDSSNVPEHTVTAGPETDLPLRLRPKKYLVLDLKQEFGHAAVNNPENVTVVPYGPRSVAVYPHKEGAAHITIYGRSGEVLVARYVVVATIEKKYVKLRETCKEGPNCARTVTYYCPNLCYQTRVAMSPAGSRIPQD